MSVLIVSLHFIISSLNPLLTSGHVRFEKAPNHALYISTIELKEDFLLVKVFTDDLTDAIRNGFDEYKSTKEVDFFPSNRGLVEAYFQGHLLVSINKKPIRFTLESTNTEGDTNWLVFSLNTPSRWNTLQVKANYFMELFPDQTNILKVFYKEQTRLCKFVINSERCDLSFSS